MTKFEILQNHLAANANPAIAAIIEKSMQNRFKFYGIPGEMRKELTSMFIEEDRARHTFDHDFIEQCYESEYREITYFANDYLLVMESYITKEDMPGLLKNFEEKQWYDTMDFVLAFIEGLEFDDEGLDSLMLEWSKADEVWKKKVALEHQVSRKERTNTELLKEIIANNFDSTDETIHIAIGKALRAYSLTDTDWVMAFVKEHEKELNVFSANDALRYIRLPECECSKE